MKLWSALRAVEVIEVRKTAGARPRNLHDASPTQGNPVFWRCCRRSSTGVDECREFRKSRGMALCSPQ
jgi:hypothetical protein